MNQVKAKSKSLGVYIIACTVSYLSLTGTIQSQEYFPIGAWCFCISGPSPFDPNNPGHLNSAEKDKLQNLGLNYFIACQSASAEQALINYGDDQGVTFKITVESTPVGYPSPGNEYSPWIYSRQGYGNKEDQAWQDVVRNGYGGIANEYDNRSGLHSALVAAEKVREHSDRWDEEPGYKSVTWDGTSDLGQQVSAGVYLYRIQAGDFTQTRKMLLLK